MRQAHRWLFGALVVAVGSRSALCQQHTSATKAPSNLRPLTTKVDVKRLRSITTQMTMGEILKRLGKEEKDIGSGIYILCWRGTDGSELFVGTSTLRPNAKPQYVHLRKVQQRRDARKRKHT